MNVLFFVMLIRFSSYLNVPYTTQSLLHFNFRSLRDNIIFQEMRLYLTELTKVIGPGTTYTRRRSSENLNVPLECSPPPCKKRRRHIDDTDVVLLDLLTFFIDIAGTVREKSQFKVYTNHYYTVSKNSLPVFLEVIRSR